MKLRSLRKLAERATVLVAILGTTVGGLPLHGQSPSPNPHTISQVGDSAAQPSATFGFQFSSHPSPAPDFNLTDISGERISLERFRGKVVLLNFWATWCPPCQEEIPELVGFQTRYESRGFQVIGIASNDRRNAVRKFYRDDMMNYPVAMANAGILSAYRVGYTLPTIFLIGRDGRVYARILGAPPDLNALKPAIRALLDPLSVYPPKLMGAASPPAPASKPAATTPQSLPARPAVVTPPEAKPAAAPTPPSAPKPDLTDPNPAQIESIINKFAANETRMEQAFHNYDYHQINRVYTLDADGYINGSWKQDWDVFYAHGQREERVTYAPVDDLKGILMTEQDVDGFQRIQPFVLTSADLRDFEVKYVSHVTLNKYINAYVFSIRPKVIQKGHQYFKGYIWVDDRDLQIVQTQGREVPQVHKHGQQNLFPEFTTYRSQIDGKYWFPIEILADDTLYFSEGPVHIHEAVKFTNYKQFTSRTRILSVKALPKKSPNGQ